MHTTLHPWSPNDKDQLMNLCNSVDRRYLADRLPNPYTMEDADFWLNLVSNAEKDKTGLFRAIVADDTIVGSISIECKGDIFRIDGEIGYMILTDYWNKGIATKAVGEIYKLAFNILYISRISAKIFEENIASAKVLEKNGYILEGIMKNAVIKNGIIHNVLHYGLVK